MNITIATTAIMMLMTTANVSTIPHSTGTKVSKDLAFEAEVIPKQNNVIEFRVIKPADEKVVLKIYSITDHKLYQRTLHKEKALELNCDMSECPAGTYTAVVERDGIEVIKKPITLK